MPLRSIAHQFHFVTDLRLERLEDRTTPSATNLGVATQFNVFVFDDYTASWTDAEARVAVGDDATRTGHGVGASLTDSDGPRDNLIDDGELDVHHRQVASGNAIEARQGTDVLDFASAKSELQQKSIDWGAIAVGIDGSMLARQAGVTFNNGLFFAGTLVANSLIGGVQFNRHVPTIDIENPEPPPPPPPPPVATGNLQGLVFQGQGRFVEGIPDLPVNLIVSDANGDPLFGLSTPTDLQGMYYFEDLPEGSYTVSLDLNKTRFAVHDEDPGTTPANPGSVEGTISEILVTAGDPLFGFKFELPQPSP